MTTPRRSRWNQRRFVSLGVLFSGLCLPVTGLSDHLARHSSPGPQASMAWVAAHVAMGSLFVVLVVWHVVLNRRALAKYVRGTRDNTALPSLETIAALGLVVGTLALTLGHA